MILLLIIANFIKNVNTFDKIINTRTIFHKELAMSTSSNNKKPRTKDFILPYIDKSELDIWKDLKKEVKPKKKLTQLLVDLSNSSIQKLDGDVTAIKLGKNGKLPDIQRNKYSPDTIFARSFYPKLLSEIRCDKNVILLSNPGTSKSMFQYYYLATLMNTKILGPSPDNDLKLNESPKVIIRQIGRESMEIYLTKEKLGFELDGFRISLLKCFDDKCTEYWYEPNQDLIGPSYGINIRTFITVSPDLRRYKEFLKNAEPKVVYMPLYKEVELQIIGKYIRDNSVLSEKEIEFISADKISERFNEYNGIFRHVFPSDETNEILDKQNKLEAIDNFDFRAYENSISLRNSWISHYLVICVVEENLLEAKYEYINDNFYYSISEKFNLMTLEEQIKLLISIDLGKNEDKKSLFYLFYEIVIAKLLTQPNGVDWRKKSNDKGKLTGKFENFQLALKEIKKTIPPKYQDMEIDVLYYPPRQNYPFLDFLYKNSEGLVVCIKVKGSLSKEAFNVTIDSFNKNLLKPFEIKDPKLVKYVLIPHPSKFDKVSVTGDFGESFDNIEIWRVPHDFTRSFDMRK